MKYKVKIRCYETVIRDCEVEVEARGRIMAANIAKAQVHAGQVKWGEPQTGFDRNFEVLSSEKVEREKEDHVT